MLAMLGAMGVLLAGMALPMFFDDDEEEAEIEDRSGFPEDGDQELTVADTDWMEDEPEVESAPQAPLEGSAIAADGEVPVEEESAADAMAADPLEGAESELVTPEGPVPPGSPPDPTDTSDHEAGEEPPGAQPRVALTGDADDDLLEGEDGDDTLGAEAGDDSLSGGEGDDSLSGEPGNDLLRGGVGDDRLIDGDGEDTLSGGAGDDTIIGNAFGHKPLGEEGRDHLHGGAGDDAIFVGAMDFVTGGEGADTFTVSSGIAIGEQAEIVDFEPAEDKLVLLWDDSLGSDPPEVTLGAIEDAADMAQVLLDGIVVAHVAGAPDLRIEDIELVPMSEV